MASSNLSMSEHNKALLRKFQGNGWAVAYSPSSVEELYSVLQDSSQLRPEADEEESKWTPALDYEKDWADKVLARSIEWSPEQGITPLWVTKATQTSDFALFQLPAPDRRWVLKFSGNILEPFSSRCLGWEDLHELVTHGHLLERAEAAAQVTGIADLRGQKSRPITGRGADIDKCINGEVASGYSATGARLRETVRTPDGRTETQTSRTCADDFNKQVRDRLDRVLALIERKHKRAASHIREAIRSTNGRLLFVDSREWTTALADVPYDAAMVLKGKVWEITFPDSSEPLTIPDSVGIRAIARLLMCGNFGCPSALLADSDLLNEFLSRPRHHRYFDAIYRRPRVTSGDPNNSGVETAICAAMHLKHGWWYTADHVISESSDLHTICGLPAARVTLKCAESLDGIRNLLKQQEARLFFCKPIAPRFKRVSADIEAGIRFARKQEGLLQQIQSKSEALKDNLYKAVQRLRGELATMGDWTTRYDLFADHLSAHVHGGTVFQYVGPYRWRVEGLPQMPDTFDLADDHVYFKRRKVARAKRKARAKTEASERLRILAITLKV